VLKEYAAGEKSLDGVAQRLRVRMREEQMQELCTVTGLDKDSIYIVVNINVFISGETQQDQEY
jgi:hypothetical protein